jgi:catecholate siderophore receptor
MGLVLKPVAPVSLYANYSVSYLPSSGDQFSSLTAITQQVKPEKFNSYEVGAKWDVSRSLTLTTAVYRLDRTIRAPQIRTIPGESYRPAANAPMAGNLE